MTDKDNYLVCSFVHVGFGVHLNSRSRIPSLDEELLSELQDWKIQVS